MSAPLIGMSFLSFLSLLIISAVVAGIVHWWIRYRLFHGFDGYIAQWILAWVGAWLGPPVLGHWFGPVMWWHIYVIPAVIGSFAGAFAGTFNARVIAGMSAQRNPHP